MKILEYWNEYYEAKVYVTVNDFTGCAVFSCHCSSKEDHRKPICGACADAIERHLAGRLCEEKS